MAPADENSQIEYGYLSLNHKGEELCGDHVEISEGNDLSLTLVLADGLGSGVEASILSTLTSTLLSKMIEGGMGIEEGVESLAKTLPVARDRGNVAYSTFTVVKIEKDFTASLYNFDNPDPIFLRNGKSIPIDYAIEEIGGKRIKKAKLYFDKNDSLCLYSDGALHAGVGETLNFGWGREEIASYLEGLASPYLSCKNLATLLVDHCSLLYNRRPGDDTTCLCIRRRERELANLLVGPAASREDDENMLNSFFALPGKHIVCGGTTCKIVSRHLGSPIRGDLISLDPDIPPYCLIDGVDLATEGIITLNKVLALAEDYQNGNSAYFTWSYRQDGASLLANALFQDATDITFYVGCAVNPAHQEDQGKITFKMKMQIIDNLAKELRNMGKRIKVLYF
ncbi:serine/threonine-protein phosphatase [bacterium]|nr:serine/threonine-protein phosphatase [bacterium]